MATFPFTFGYDIFDYAGVPLKRRLTVTASGHLIWVLFR
jgi:hypothetical protein